MNTILRRGGQQLFCVAYGCRHGTVKKKPTKADLCEACAKTASAASARSLPTRSRSASRSRTRSHRSAPSDTFLARLQMLNGRLHAAHDKLQKVQQTLEDVKHGFDDLIADVEDSEL